MKYINDIYSSPVYHWLFFLKYNNLSFLRLNALDIPPNKIGTDDSKEAVEAYHSINDQIIQEFGIDADFLELKELEKDIAILKLQFINDGNRSKRTQWRIKEAELGTPEQRDDKELDIAKEIEIISSHIGGGTINIKTYTIHQYLISRKSVSNGNK